MDELRQRFNPDGSLLRQHQLRMLEMLLYIDGLCRKHGIPYWLSSGTLLGAVRHGGFIPWDDDVDIEMMREDYLKLSKILKEDTQYYFQSYKTDKYYVAPYAKLRDKNSEIREHGQDENYKFKGIYIDIFVLEYNYVFLEKLYKVAVWRLMTLGAKAENKWKKHLFFILKYIYNFSIHCVRFFVKMFPGKKLRHTYGAAFVGKTRYENKIFPLVEIEFEGHRFNAPNDSDFYLRTLFGDYMQLPNLDKIAFHVQNVKIY